MTTIYTASAILLSVAAVCGFRQWRKLGERIQPEAISFSLNMPDTVEQLEEQGYVVVTDKGIVSPREFFAKPAPKIIQMSRREPMRKRKIKKQERSSRIWAREDDA